MELSYIHLTIILLPKTSKVIGANFLAAHKKSEKRRSIIMIHTHSFAFLRKTWANGFSCLRKWWVEMCGYVCGQELHIRGWQCEIMTHDHNGVNHFSKRMEFLIGIKTPFCSFGFLSLLPYLYSTWIIWKLMKVDTFGIIFESILRNQQIFLGRNAKVVGAYCAPQKNWFKSRNFLIANYEPVISNIWDEKYLIFV